MLQIMGVVDACNARLVEKKVNITLHVQAVKAVHLIFHFWPAAPSALTLKFQSSMKWRERRHAMSLCCLLRCLQVVLVVSRWFGGILLRPEGPAR